MLLRAYSKASWGLLGLASILAGATSFACSSSPGASSNSNESSAVAGDKAAASGTVVFDARSEPVGSNCANGGVALLSGPDKNRNGKLDPGEVTNTKYVCNGTAGAAGKNSLIATQAVPAGGSVCPTGGISVASGLDINSNSVLDANEVKSVQYVCNGATGSPGATGVQGPSGAPGAAAVVTTKSEASGANCAGGGVRIDSGVDSNSNAVLDPAEISSTQFVCNGQDSTSVGGVAVIATNNSEPPGVNCTYGGVRIESGPDTNATGVLDADELSHTQYHCVLNRVYAEAAGSNCAKGGARVDTGIDSNANLSLEPEEVTETQFVCNGPSAPSVKALALGNYDSCAVLEDGRAMCWGYNMFGQLGNGTHDDWLIPMPVYGLTGVASLAAGEKHSCALLMDGNVQCWGNNEAGQLGNGTTTASLVPVQAPYYPNVTKIAVGMNDTCVISDGAVYCWGYDYQGSAKATGAVDLSVSWGHACAALSDGTVNCWGDNRWGQLGNGETNPYHESWYPVSTVVGINNAIAITVGESFSCALLSDHTVSCWGNNESGQLGNGTLTDSTVPTPVVGLENVASLSAGFRHTCAVLEDGTARCWGNGGQGELGAGPDVIGNAYPAPVTVLGLSNVKSIAAGGYHSCAITVDGSASCWGDLAGDGSWNWPLVPSPVAGLSH